MSFLVSVLAFAKNGEGEEFYDRTEVVGEITEVDDGKVEIAFNTPAKERHYITFDLATVTREALMFGAESK